MPGRARKFLSGDSTILSLDAVKYASCSYFTWDLMGSLLVVIGNSPWPLSFGILICSAENIILVYSKEANV